MKRTASIIGLLLLLGSAAAWAFWDLPPHPPAKEFGNFLINRTSEKNNVKPATFSHWVHRQKHTCRVCHFELDFAFKVNTTEITEAANKAGQYCGAPGCHDGTTVFGHEKPHCEKCHNGDLNYSKGKFSNLKNFPKAKYGNEVDWVKALERGLIKPKTELTMPPADMSFEKLLNLEAEWSNIPPAIFPHKEHIAWLDCNNCHPYIFNIKKKTTKHFEMVRILKGEFCGACHLNVAFPMDDCRRCHPKMSNR